jgi:hypothetical protein
MPAKKTAKVSKPARKTKQDHRTPGKTQTSISLNTASLEWARGKAKADGRSLSNWIERLIASKEDAE